MIGGFIIIASFMIAGSIYMFAKGRELVAFGTQQIMPVAQEKVQKMAPTIGKDKDTISKEMAPAYGEIAKEVSKRIKEGIQDNDQN